MEAPFKIGQKVICVDDSKQGEKFNSSIAIKIDFVVKGQVYTVRGFKKSSDGIGLYLEGVFLGIHHSGNEVASNPARFAPFHEQRERINYVAVSETLRETSVETFITQTN